ncbi:hypothetical protein [Saccharothrix syringae]|uniref:PLL-like beta propeller domain-containing protein n=1 Tax=Saccharothrix syringae TaxID=103733 RepID=A0A5Q0H4L7_SACSY|nr:hypothetical protein [Saccharothrix syringae]QFZ20750.1 hypothetical protein EKG83_28120 [Saccharothrix syringae]
MGWTEIPGGALTDLPVTAVADGNGELLAFIVGTDRQIYVNQSKGGDWVGWSSVPGGAKTTQPVAVARDTDGQVIVIHIGQDGHLYEAKLASSKWTAWRLADDEAATSMAAAIATVNNSRFVFHVGKDQRIYTQETVVLTAE